MTLVDGGDEVDGLDLGRPPRAPMSLRTRRLIASGATVVAAGTVAALLIVHVGGADRTPAAQASTTPVVESSAGFAAGPVLTTVDGRDAILPPGLPGLGSSVRPVPLEPAPDVVAVVAAALPGFGDVRGGRIGDPDRKFGIYLAGTYRGPGNAPVSVSIYTVKAPGTTFGTDQFVSRSLIDRAYNVRTDVSVFTGSGWWVHVVTLGPDDPDTVSRGEIDRVLPLAENPALVASA